LNDGSCTTAVPRLAKPARHYGHTRGQSRSLTDFNVFSAMRRVAALSRWLRQPRHDVCAGMDGHALAADTDPRRSLGSAS